MTRDEFDPIEWLSRRDPLRGDVSVSDADADKTLDRVFAAVSRDRRHRSRNLIPVAVAVAALAATAAAVVWTRPAEDPVGVMCHSEFDLDADAALVPYSGTPVKTCEQAWSNPELVDIFGSDPAPPLVGCVLGDGVAAVFPRSNAATCGDLGLAELDGGFDDLDALNAFQSTVVDQLLGQCVSPDDTASIVRTELDTAGLAHWDVAASEPPQGEWCGSIAVDPQAQTVSIVPIPPAPTP